MPAREKEPSVLEVGQTVPRLGAHMSIAGGMTEAVRRAKAVGATALQVFVKSSNQWAARPFAPGEPEAFRAAAKAGGLDSFTVAHASYLINVASPDEALWEKSVRALGVEIGRCASLGVPSLVIHPGSHMGAGEADGLSRVVRALDLLLAAPRCSTRGVGEVRVLLEITAGQGTNLGARFEHLAWILSRTRRPERLGVCFDTCHALAAGYEFRDGRSYRQTFRALDRTVGLERVRAIHLNDSQSPFGSHRDRHAHIGQGELGLEAFRLILNDPHFRDVPMVLETPKGKDLAEDRMNLAVLRELVGR